MERNVTGLFKGKRSVKECYIESSINKLNYLSELDFGKEEDLVIAERIIETLDRNMMVLSDEVDKCAKKQKVKKSESMKRKY